MSISATHGLLLALSTSTLLAIGCSDSEAESLPPEPTWPDESSDLLGGTTTVDNSGVAAFRLPMTGLTQEERQTFSLGNVFFGRNWTIAPASAVSSDGLGPTFNATSCTPCHSRDGRGKPPDNPAESMEGLLLRLSIPGRGPHGEPLEEPAYGGQFQPSAIDNIPDEGGIAIQHQPLAGSFSDGTPYQLSRPLYTFESLAFGPMASDVMTSPRVGPQMIGLGLLEAIPEATIVSWADPDDIDGDGISGRINRVWDVKSQTTKLGRFGWKANQPNLLQQVAGAFAGDIGITSSLFPKADCPIPQMACAKAPSGGEPEISDEKLRWVEFYSRTLAVPRARDLHRPEVVAGHATFVRIGCTGCHIETARTGVFEDIPLLSNQTIHPYTDMLLHDMGADLADNRPDFEATGVEWRTPPLWGIGLFKTVNDHTRYMHDGRARNLEEAILWHGGEAAGSQSAYRSLPFESRQQLLVFLESL